MIRGFPCKVGSFYPVHDVKGYSFFRATGKEPTLSWPQPLVDNVRKVNNGPFRPVEYLQVVAAMHVERHRWIAFLASHGNLAACTALVPSYVHTVHATEAAHKPESGKHGLVPCYLLGGRRDLHPEPRNPGMEEGLQGWPADLRSIGHSIEGASQRQDAEGC